MRAVTRTLAVLEALNTPIGATVVELAAATGISRPALYRIVEALQEAGYVKLDLAGERFRLTRAIRGLSQGFTDLDWVSEVAEPVMRQLTEQIMWPCDIGTYQDDCIMLAATTRPVSSMTLDRGAVGQRFPVLGCATGLAYLSFCPDDEREEILLALERSEKPLNRIATDRPYVDRLIAETRAAGYGARRRGFAQESNAIAVPIMVGPRVYGSLNLTFSARAMTVEGAAERFLAPLQAAATEIAQRLQNSQAIWAA